MMGVLVGDFNPGIETKLTQLGNLLGCRHPQITHLVGALDMDRGPVGLIVTMRLASISHHLFNRMHVESDRTILLALTPMTYRCYHRRRVLVLEDHPHSIA